jgi:hypothetical protein
MRSSLYLFDPDEDEQTIQRAALRAKTPLQERALAACGRKYFKSTEERKRWRLLEGKTLGGTDEQILYAAWLYHNIELWEKANSKMVERIFYKLMSAMENEERRIDWEVANRAKVFADRKIDVSALFEKGKTDDNRPHI